MSAPTRRDGPADQARADEDIGSEQPVGSEQHVRSDEYAGLTSEGRGSALQGMLLHEDPTAYYSIQQDMFNHLDNDDYDSLSGTNDNFNALLAVHKCDENNMNAILQNSPAYNGRCPNRHNRPPPKSVRPCEGPQRQKEGQVVPIPVETTHQNPHMVCNLCRKMFWKTIYDEQLVQNRSNKQRLRNLITFQQVSVCLRCDNEQQGTHSVPTNECTCYEDIRKSHWRCMHCTRHTIAVVDKEVRWRRSMLRYIRRDQNYQLRFDRRRSHDRVWCPCDRGPAMARANNITRTLQCIRCEGYIVKRANGTLKRSQRIKNRSPRAAEAPELRMLVNSRGSLRTAPIGVQGFPNLLQAR